MRKNKLLLIISLFLCVGLCSCKKEETSTTDETQSETVYVTLKQMKINAINEINNYVTLTDYRDAQKTEINSIITDYTTQITDTKSKDTVTELLAQAKAAIDEVKTDEELTAEEEEIQSTDYHVYNYMSKTETYNILMLGSSYLFYYDQYKMLDEMLEEQGYEANVEQIVRSSATLENFTTTSDSLYTALNNKLNNKQYDYIFLEELSTRPLKNYDLFDKAVGDLTSMFKEKQDHAEVILFEVWARDERCSWYNENSTYTYDSMQEGLADAYTTVANKYNLRVSYAGQSFSKMYHDSSLGINLYHTDFTHPNLYGSYLSALTHFNTLTGDDISTVTYYPTNFVVSTPSSVAGTYSITADQFSKLKTCVTNTYKSNTIKTLKVYVWASGTGTDASYYTDAEMEEIRTRFAKKYKKVLFKWTALYKYSKSSIAALALNVTDADVYLAGNNMDSECSISLNTSEGYEKAKLGDGWTNKASRYIGIASTCKNLETAKEFRDMLVEKYVSLDESKKVLFIGNSYTYFNDMYMMFQDICVSKGIDVKAYKVTLGSRKLLDYATEDDTTKDLIAKLDANDFDYIVIQEHSTRPINGAGNFRSGIQTIKNLMTAHNNSDAQMILYDTWAKPEANSFYQTNYTQYSNFADKYKAMCQDLANSYYTEGQYFGAKVSYVGIAFYEIFVNYDSSEINLYHTDNNHPTAVGTYLIALTHAATIFNIDPRTVSYIPSYTSFNDGGAPCVMPTETQAVALRNAAYEAVYNFNINTYFN